MPRLFPLTVLLVALAATARAEDAVFAEYWTGNGSLPPKHAWQTEVAILADGSLTLTHCKGADETGKGCRTRRATVAPQALAAIRAAAAESGLASAPARETDMPVVGSSLTGGKVWLDGDQIVLPPQPAAPDAARVAAVVTAIEAAIPARFDRFLQD